MRVADLVRHANAPHVLCTLLASSVTAWPQSSTNTWHRRRCPGKRPLRRRGRTALLDDTVVVWYWPSPCPHRAARRNPLGNLRILRDVIKHSIRNHAEDLCTEQFGFRTLGDAIESGRREFEALHVTNLDRELLRKMSPTLEEWGSLQTAEPAGSELQRIKAAQLQARLAHSPNSISLSPPRGDIGRSGPISIANDRQRSRAIKVTSILDRKNAEQSRPG
jgi:hypothetical protein